MWGFYNYDRVQLILKKGKIDSIKNLKDLMHPNDFAPDFKESKQAKIYLIKDESFYCYVGATTQPIRTKIAQGLSADGLNGYHGYKWKDLHKVELFVWNFSGIEKMQMESIEAELVYQIRAKYGCWPKYQNEIHFNNNFDFAREIGNDIFHYLETEYPLNSKLGYNKETEELFKEPSQYGLRGDPYLWKDFKSRYEYSSVDNLEQFEKLLNLGFVENTGNKPTKGKHFFAKDLSFGGMSSGKISSDFWLDKGFPLLVERFKKLKK